MVEYEDVTDYQSIPQMQKEFKPFYDLWTTVEAWKTKHGGWLHGPFDEIDAANVEETVDNSKKTMAQVIRALKDKELPEILKIASI